MKKTTTLLLLLAGVLCLFSCSDNDTPEQLTTLTVQLSSKVGISDYSRFTVTVTDAKSGSPYHATADASGKATFALPLGQYSIAAEDKANGAATMYGALDNFTLSAATSTATLELKDIRSSLAKTFVLDELFFNCTANGDFDYNYYEEYFTIRNISDRPLYADGLSFAICGDYNALDDDGTKSAYTARDSIIVSQLYTIPGSGRDHVVMPGKSLVIAHSAIDHTEKGAKPKAVDLSGADFEVYVPHEHAMTTDNPEVPNLVVNYSMFQAFSWGYGGHAPMMLVRAETDNLDNYVKSHLRNMKVTGAYGNQLQDYLVIPTSWIVDGVETASADNMVHKVLPASVDKSYVTIDDTGMYGGFKGQFVQRKPAATGYLQDTNDSKNDFVVVPNGQKSYPKK